MGEPRAIAISSKGKIPQRPKKAEEQETEESALFKFFEGIQQHGVQEYKASIEALIKVGACGLFKAATPRDAVVTAMTNYFMGCGYYHLSNFSEASKHLKEAHKQLQKGLVAVSTDHPDGLLDSFNQRQPDYFAETLLILGICEKELGQAENLNAAADYFVHAIAQWGDLFTKDPQSVAAKRKLGESNLNLGEVYTRLGQYDKAIPFLKTAKKLLDQPADKFMLAFANRYLGMCFLKMHQYDQAITSLDHAYQWAVKNENEDKRAEGMRADTALGLGLSYGKLSGFSDNDAETYLAEARAYYDAHKSHLAVCQVVLDHWFKDLELPPENHRATELDKLISIQHYHGDTTDDEVEETLTIAEAKHIYNSFS